MPFYLQRYPSNEKPEPILTPRKNIKWEASAVFNPGVIRDGDIFRMLYRTYPEGTKRKDERYHRPGYYYFNRISCIGYAESTDGIHFTQRDIPLIAPDQPYDLFGCEDPRITKIGDTFYITYTAIDNPLDTSDIDKLPNIRIALATTKDFQTITKHGIIGPPEKSKAAALFSDPVNNGKIALAMTISSDSENSHVAIRYYDSIEEFLHPSGEEWKKFLGHSKETAFLKTYWWLHRGPELGAPPIQTDRGWLFLYSSESMSHSWTISAALTNSNEPHKLLSRTPGYLLQPVTDYERNGLVPQVTYPSGAVVVDDELYVYYGCADTVIGLAKCNLNALLDYLEEFKKFV